MPFDDETFDGAVCGEVLEHVLPEDGGDRGGVAELHRVLKARSPLVVSVPLNPKFTSLNLAQAVLLVGYEWFQTADRTPGEGLALPKETRPANKQEMLGLFEHLESE